MFGTLLWPQEGDELWQRVRLGQGSTWLFHGMFTGCSMGNTDPSPPPARTVRSPPPLLQPTVVPPDLPGSDSGSGSSPSPPAAPHPTLRCPS